MAFQSTILGTATVVAGTFGLVRFLKVPESWGCVYWKVVGKLELTISYCSSPNLDVAALNFGVA